MTTWTEVFKHCANVIVADFPEHYCVPGCAVDREFLQRSCPTCGKRMNHKRLNAKASAKKCGAACHGSKSASCACQCAGTNHGKVWRLPAASLDAALAVRS